MDANGPQQGENRVWVTVHRRRLFPDFDAPRPRVSSTAQEPLTSRLDSSLITPPTVLVYAPASSAPSPFARGSPVLLLLSGHRCCEVLAPTRAHLPSCLIRALKSPFVLVTLRVPSSAPLWAPVPSQPHIACRGEAPITALPASQTSLSVPSFPPGVLLLLALAARSTGPPFMKADHRAVPDALSAKRDERQEASRPHRKVPPQHSPSMDGGKGLNNVTSRGLWCEVNRDRLPPRAPSADEDLTRGCSGAGLR